MLGLFASARTCFHSGSSLHTPPHTTVSLFLSNACQCASTDVIWFYRRASRPEGRLQGRLPLHRGHQSCRQHCIIGHESRHCRLLEPVALWRCFGAWRLWRRVSLGRHRTLLRLCLAPQADLIAAQRSAHRRHRVHTN
ncbi:hypothetical protein FIBSPDRAFT_115405 [Athelia psychrophila]|uniref:Uncharacterized protein n=1 Tax=Athelia psychrophila TaxID=1759441 RepID=A0A166D3H2_9AGAM|nr:hypothetical protein FIBSPDRAFT_115405 [Fibularhizoctonia sp. CBS 109695]